MAFRFPRICLVALLAVAFVPGLALAQPKAELDPTGQAPEVEVGTEPESETDDQLPGELGSRTASDSDPNFSQAWCDRCKSAEQPTCRTECKEVQGRKYFVCLEECSLKRCNSSCTPIADDPKELERRAEKTCAQCRREFSRSCKDSCAQKRGRARSQCRKVCVDSSCVDTCPKKPKANLRENSKPGEAQEPSSADEEIGEPAAEQAARKKPKQRNKRARKPTQAETVVVEEIDPELDPGEADTELELEESAAEE